MEWLNYHHLLYFWTAAREGGISKAAQKLRLSHPTISAQIRRLEESLETELFERSGRSIKLSADGEVAFRYAEEIFSLGRELLNVIHKRPMARRLRIDVGVSDGMPKMVAHRLLQPILGHSEATQIRCHEGNLDSLLGALAVHRLDVVLADAPIPDGLHIKAFNHMVGQCGMTWLATKLLAKKYRKDFPESLEGAPVLLPAPGQQSRRALDAWFEKHEIEPEIVAEFSESALLKIFGETGAGLFAVPTATANEVKKKYQVVEVGVNDSVVQQFFVISPERRIHHPAVRKIFTEAQSDLFGTSARE